MSLLATIVLLAVSDKIFNFNFKECYYKLQIILKEKFWL
jgi:hypothetical protein